MVHTLRFLLLSLLWLLFPLIAKSEGEYERRIRTAELAGDRDQVALICREWQRSGQCSSGLLSWCYNALMSLETNAILLAQTDHDTYPVWLLQYALGVRPDVTVLSLPLLEDAAYRERVIQKSGRKDIPIGCSLPTFLNKLTTAQNAFNKHNPLYFSLLLDKVRLQAEQQHLYLTGLAMRWSPQAFDNVAVLRDNYENRFLTDYLRVDLQPEADPGLIASLNLHYIPAFLLLHRHYVAAGETAKADALQSLTLQVARKSGRESELQAFFFPEKNTDTVFFTNLTAKGLEKNMKKIKGKLWAAETETTNAQYEMFLQDLLKNKDFDQLNQCRTTKVDWRGLLPDSLRNLPDTELYKHGHPDEPACPVVSISHEAARRYCAWITKVYNTSTDKKKFKKVLFRLPTEQEWELAALGGREAVPYPWGGYYVQNSKGCYLGNYNVTKPCQDCSIKSAAAQDGGVFSVKADSYYPNDLGMYCISGNVAEMVSVPGVSKGGSWQDVPYYGQISVGKKQDAPSPSTGFRVFMEVIEEER